MSRMSKKIATARSPKREGRCPRLTGLVALSVVFACSNGGVDQVTSPVAVGMTDHVAPYYDDGQLKLYEVQKAVPLPVRRPTGAEIQGPAPKGTPYSHAPYLLVSDESVEVHYVISNVDSGQHNVWVLIDPWNEFVRWRPGVTVVNDEETIPNFGFDLAFVVPGKSRVEGTLTPDDLKEIAIKLAAVQNLLASPQAKQSQGMTTPNAFDATAVANNIFNPQNRSNSVPPDLLYKPWIPPVIAGITGFDLGLRTLEAANVAVEITIDVQDLNGQRFVAADSTDPQLGPPPRALSPPGARF
jgi:hypothetical protein